MRAYGRWVKIAQLYLAFALFGCGLMDKPAKKIPPEGIVTPEAKYSTQKARSLGEKYKDNLEQLVAEIVHNPTTKGLQFNDLGSPGSIGFFTHSASKSPDERYLEVILTVPDILDEKTDLSLKLERLFSKYGSALLSILSADSDIYNDGDLTGYGLNFSWSSSQNAPGGRITTERVVLYFPKEKVRTYLNKQIGKEDLLTGSVIFAIQEDRAPRQIRYRTPPKPSKDKMAPRLGLKKKLPAPLKQRRESPVMRGFIVQLSFAGRKAAERWSDILSRQGYSTLTSVVGEGRSVRLRVGSFPSFKKANRLLGRLRRQGLTGFVLQMSK